MVRRRRQGGDLADQCRRRDHGFAIPPCTGCASSGGSGTGNIISGPGGALWYSRPGNIAIGRISTTGQVHEFPVPARLGSAPGWITAGPAGNLRFTVPYSGEVGRLTPTGHAAWFRIASNCYPGDIAAGAGSLWVTCQNLSLLYRISTRGAISPITVPRNGHLGGTAAAPGGAMWFTDLAHGLLATITAP